MKKQSVWSSFVQGWDQPVICTLGQLLVVIIGTMLVTVVMVIAALWLSREHIHPAMTSKHHEDMRGTPPHGPDALAPLHDRLADRLDKLEALRIWALDNDLDVTDFDERYDAVVLLQRQIDRLHRTRPRGADRPSTARPEMRQRFDDIRQSLLSHLAAIDEIVVGRKSSVDQGFDAAGGDAE